MKIEFLMKWTEDLPPEEQEEYTLERVLGKREEEGAPRKIVYREVVIDINPNISFNRAESGHTAVRTEDDFFILKIPYQNFKEIYGFVTSEYIKHYKDFEFLDEEDVPEIK